MKKNYLLMGLFAMGLTMTTVSCSSDDDGISEEEAQNAEYTAENKDAWGNYAANVALLLKQDATKLHDSWKNEFAEAFKNHTSGSGYQSSADCIDQMIDGMVDIANEVGGSKIGEPYNYWVSGQEKKAVYAVESWYSWHSRDDYKNNILSIAHAFSGERITGNPADYNFVDSLSAGKLTENSILAYCYSSSTLKAKGQDVWKKIGAAWTAIDEIPQPFRNNIGSSQSEAAMTACENLTKSLESLKTDLHASFTNSDEKAKEIVAQFVDVVVMPTYSDLVARNTELYNAVVRLQANPTNTAFENACQAWLDARMPWETSEAFLFGPVAQMGLDPNMDSWPLDAVGIYNLLKSQKWSEMNWSGEFDEDNEAIGAAQSLRGFHTLEFLLFKNGQPRTVNTAK